MAQFNFGRGNITKLLSLPLYLVGAVAGAVIPRRSDLWVFASGIGIGEGALAVYNYARVAKPNRTYLWLVRNGEDLRRAQNLGVEAVLKNSWRGWWLTLRASVLIVTHGFGDVNRFGTAGAYIVQLWHGIPFKKLHLDSPHVLRLPGLGTSPPARKIMQTAYRRAGAKISLFPVASQEAKARIVSAFNVDPQRVAITGDPRDDVIFDATQTLTARRKITRYELVNILGRDFQMGNKTVLYAPTWRDGKQDPAVPTPAQWREIASLLDEYDLSLLIRSHPLGRGNYDVARAFSPRIASLNSDIVADLNTVLVGIDYLITDFSSVAYDFAITARPIIFFAPDAQNYLAERGSYEPWDAMTGGSQTTHWKGVIRELVRLESNQEYAAKRVAHSQALRDRFYEFHDANSAQRVFDRIQTDQT